MSPPSRHHALQFRNVTVRFGGVQALDAITFDVEGSTIFGIIGPNGAGKTTLFNCVSGVIRPMSGSEILYEGRDLVGLSTVCGCDADALGDLPVQHPDHP